ncbi:hypothetical protein SAMN05216238_101404 [Lentibacillus persicus]|uniref:Peptide zinc metalloprotease protein n=1 Tax=Lentibacillus persicus TaxID=640948 RepID=A0A1I1SN00_9BACI|nr:hypothetical protein SAMN05216238_101404 [Lentibacillus persicus]
MGNEIKPEQVQLQGCWDLTSSILLSTDETGSDPFNDMKLTFNTTLTLHPLQIHPDRKHYIVEDSLSGDYYEMPQVCIDAIELLNKGKTLGEIETALIHDYPEEAVELIPFAEQLVELGLVKEIDGEQVGQKKKNHAPSGLEWVPVRAGTFFFNAITVKLYWVFFVVNIIFVVWNPWLLPSYADIFLFDSMMMSMAAYLIISLVLIIIHESGHILATRAHGLPANLEIGHRLFLVVFETDLTPAWKLTPKQRNRLYFAGMSFEQVILFIAFCFILFVPFEDALYIGIMKLVVFDLFVKFIYQCCFYMKTDMYYAVENLSGCYNLMERGKAFLRSRIGNEDNGDYQNEAKTVKYYSVFYLCGIMLMAGLFFLFFLPQALFAFSESFRHIMNYTVTSPYFWDAVAFFTQVFLMLGLLLYGILKHKASR